MSGAAVYRRTAAPAAAAVPRAAAWWWARCWTVGCRLLPAFSRRIAEAPLADAAMGVAVAVAVVVAVRATLLAAHLASALDAIERLLEHSHEGVRRAQSPPARAAATTS